MINKDIVNNIVEGFIANTNYFLVETTIGTTNQIKVLIDSFENVSLDFCVQLTKEIESKLDRDVEDYELEVSSAGITSFFKVEKQYQKNIGNNVELFTTESKKIVGKLLDYNKENIEIEIETKEKPEGAKRKILVKKQFTIPIENIKTIKQHLAFK